MGTDTLEVGSESPPPVYNASSDTFKKDDLSKETVVDVEGNKDSETEGMIRDRAEATELTPVEAFKWNVDGDQSPCKLSCTHSVPSLLTLMLTYIRPQSLKSQPVSTILTTQLYHAAVSVIQTSGFVCRGKSPSDQN